MLIERNHFSVSLFFNEDKTLKSPLLLNCFCLGLVFCIIFGILYAVLIEPLYLYVHVGNDVISSALHAMLIALGGTAVCCGFFVLRNKRIVPGAFVFLAVLLLCGYLTTFHLDAERRGLAVQLLTLYCLAPVLVGNAVSWSVYLRLRDHNPGKRGKK